MNLIINPRRRTGILVKFLNSLHLLEILCLFLRLLLLKNWCQLIGIKPLFDAAPLNLFLILPLIITQLPIQYLLSPNLLIYQALLGAKHWGVNLSLPWLCKGRILLGGLTKWLGVLFCIFVRGRQVLRGGRLFGLEACFYYFGRSWLPGGRDGWWVLVGIVGGIAVVIVSVLVDFFFVLLNDLEHVVESLDYVFHVLRLEVVHLFNPLWLALSIPSSTLFFLHFLN